MPRVVNSFLAMISVAYRILKIKKTNFLFFDFIFRLDDKLLSSNKSHVLLLLLFIE